MGNETTDSSESKQIMKSSTSEEESLRKAAMAESSSPVDWCNVADYLQRKQRYDEAIGWYKKAIAAGHEQAFSNLGMLLLELGRVEEADIIFKQRSRHDSSELDSWLSIARNQIKEGDLETGLHSIRECMKISEENPEVWYLLASVMFKRESIKKAQEAIKNALAYREDYPEALRLYGQILHKRGKRKEVLKVFQRVVELTPEDSMAWSNLGVAFTNLKQNDKAMEAFQKAVELDMENRIAWRNLATLYRLEGRVLESKEADDHAKELEDFVNGD